MNFNELQGKASHGRYKKKDYFNTRSNSIEPRNMITMNSTSYNPISPTNSIGLREAMNQTVTEMGAKNQRNQHINFLSTDNANINIRENTSSDFKKLFEQ